MATKRKATTMTTPTDHDTGRQAGLAKATNNINNLLVAKTAYKASWISKTTVTTSTTTSALIAPCLTSFLAVCCHNTAAMYLPVLHQFSRMPSCRRVLPCITIYFPVFVRFSQLAPFPYDHFRSSCSIKLVDDLSRRARCSKKGARSI